MRHSVLDLQSLDVTCAPVSISNSIVLSLTGSVIVHGFPPLLVTTPRNASFLEVCESESVLVYTVLTDLQTA